MVFPYVSSSNFDVVGHCDSDWSSDLDDRKSTMKFMFFFFYWWNGVHMNVKKKTYNPSHYQNARWSTWRGSDFMCMSCNLTKKFTEWVEVSNGRFNGDFCWQ